MRLPGVKAQAMDDDRIDQIIDRHQGEASSLIQILLDIQGENRWLPREALERVGRRLAVPLSRIQHIATFYKAFSLLPKGRHQIQPAHLSPIRTNFIKSVTPIVGIGGFGSVDNTSFQRRMQFAIRHWHGAGAKSPERVEVSGIFHRANLQPFQILD